MIQNYLKTGGVSGNKYTGQRLFESANGFIMPKQGSELEKMKQIGKESVLHDYVKKACGDRTLIDNVLVTLVVMVPDQILPVHY